MNRRTWGAGMLAAVSVVSVAVLTAAGTPASAAVSAPGAAAPLPPPPVTVLTSTAQGGGDLFISPFGDQGEYANGPEILSPDGTQVVWFHPVPAGEEASR
jgi:hypothetical protein